MSLDTDRHEVNSNRPARSDPITRWLLMVAVLIILMVIVGGYVRLSRAGLSIVEWDVFSGILPPIGEAAWEETFTAYQQTPEYQLVNSGMTLAEYQRIFYIEWGHRLIARVVGLLVVLPLVWFLWKGLLSARESVRYWMIAALFGLQGVLGWLMVSSGLRDRPLVSHYRLTIHLLTALALLGIVLWLAYDRMAFPREDDTGEAHTLSSGGRTLAWVLLGAVVLQIAYGGLVAGLRAGHLSNTWPLMFGRLIPQDVFANLVEPLGSHWVHRWFAFVVAAIAVSMYVAVRRGQAENRVLRTWTGWLLIVITIQIVLGISVVWLGVPKWLALAHQAIGVALFVISVTIAHGAHPTTGARGPKPVLSSSPPRS
ncbi:MAG: COX15/CtaA family protein [Actinomycetota bacterium]|nr:COX15/CtaA family protein [Actinomycetota bacterium]